VALPPPRPAGTALVTGASSGIGEAIARGLASRGHGLTLTARREERLMDLAAELNRETGVRAGVIAADLGLAVERDRLAAEIAKAGLEVDVLVNNAGFGYNGAFVDLDRERLMSMVALNCEAVVDLCGRFLPEMVERGEGTVINIASTAAFQPLPRSATYAATKAFVLNLSEALHQELKGTGVTLTAICPGPVRSEFAERAGIGASEERSPDFLWMSSEQLAEEALDAAAKGKRAVVPGAFNLAGSWLGRFSPRKIVLPLGERIWKQVE
jgi:short-subunit dehydrogenase